MLLAVMTALSHGYVVFRQALAEELEVPVADLDYRVDEALGKMLSVFEKKQPE